jgi:hypothetical protein
MCSIIHCFKMNRGYFSVLQAFSKFLFKRIKVGNMCNIIHCFKMNQGYFSVHQGSSNL